MKENLHYSLRNTGVPPRRALQNEHFPPKKVGNAETTEKDHLRMYIFLRENCGAVLECVVFSRPECLCRMFIIHQGIRGAARAQDKTRMQEKMREERQEERREETI